MTPNPAAYAQLEEYEKDGYVKEFLFYGNRK